MRNSIPYAVVEDSDPKLFRKFAPINPSGIYPTEFNVLILPDDAETETLKNFGALQKAGFKMAEESKERHQFASISGKLIAVSPLAFTYETWPEGSERPQVGDRVLIAKYCGTNFKGRDGKDYRVTKDKDVIAVLKELPPPPYTEEIAD